MIRHDIFEVLGYGDLSQNNSLRSILNCESFTQDLSAQIFKVVEGAFISQSQKLTYSNFIVHLFNISIHKKNLYLKRPYLYVL